MKNNVRLIIHKKETLKFDISRQISEEDIVYDIYTVYYQTWVVSCHHYVIKQIMEKTNRIQCNERQMRQSDFSTKHATHPRFKLKVTIEPGDNDDVTEKAALYVD